MTTSLFTATLVLLLAFNSTSAARILKKNFQWNGTTLAGNKCYGIPPGFGPFDYTDPGIRKPNVYGKIAPLSLVEKYHFTPEVEQLIRGKSGPIVGDLDYTLRAFPNHHRALWSMARYYLRETKKRSNEDLSRAEYNKMGEPPAECYFYRAKAFAPEDSTVSAIFGIYLHKRGQLEAALAEYQNAEPENAENAEFIYNMGLLYFDMGNIEKSTEYARRAEELGFPLTGLANKIKRNKNQTSPTDAAKH